MAAEVTRPIHYTDVMRNVPWDCATYIQDVAILASTLTAEAGPPPVVAQAQVDLHRPWHSAIPIIEFSLAPKVEGTTLEVENDTGRGARLGVTGAKTTSRAWPATVIRQQAGWR